MDFVTLKSRITEYIGKYKYVWIVLLVGVVLMMLPERKKDDATIQIQAASESATEFSIEDRLGEILSHVAGAGKVKVMLSVSQGERTIYQTDTTYSQTTDHTDSRTQTILIKDDDRSESGLVHQRNPPTYQGAIILAQGADDPAVKLAIVEAVSDVTGLGADRISVLKMR